MNHPRTTILQLRLLLVFLILVVAGTIAAFFLLRQSENRTISQALLQLNRKDRNLEMVKKSFETLYEADNDFRLYTLSYDKQYYLEYREDLFSLMANLDSLYNNLENDSSDQLLVEEAVSQMLRKEIIAIDFIRLKKIADSLLRMAGQVDLLYAEGGSEAAFSVTRYYPDLKKMGLDTLSISTTTEKEKKGFFKKVKEFFAGSKEKETTTQQIRVEGDTSGIRGADTTALSVEQVSQVIAGQTNRYYQQQLRLQKAYHEKIRERERELVLANKALMEDLRKLLLSLDQAVERYTSHIHAGLARAIDRSAQRLNWLGMGSLAMVVLLLLFILFTIRQIIRQQRQIMAARNKAEEEAREKTRFFAYMSHELRTPLTSIVGFIEQMRHTPLNEEQTKFILSMKGSSEMLLTTVNDILDLSKMEAGKMTFIQAPFSPSSVVEQILSSLRPAAEQKGLQIHLQNSVDENRVLSGDEMRLKQVLINLINNAIKYTDTGAITVSLSLAPCSGKSCLTVKVTDTGRGIPPNRLQDIFSEYNQVHSQSAEKWIIGTGLGLPVCKKLVEQQGGKIWAESTGVKGSSFTFFIPFEESDEPAERVKPVPGEIDPSVFNGKRILIVDDTDINLVLLEAIFAKWGVPVDKARNGREAMKLIGSKPYDLILTDVNMPEMDGLELTKRIRKSPVPEIARQPVIILSANILQDEIDKYQHAGVSGYLTKPFLMHDLYRVICQQLR